MAHPVRIEHTVSLAWDPSAAFARLTTDPMLWWPWSPRAVKPSRVRRVGFEPRSGGEFFQEHVNGRYSTLGAVREWDPPHRIALEFCPPASPHAEERVELRLAPEATGTALTLRASTRRNPWRARTGPDAAAAAASQDAAARPARARNALLFIVHALVVAPTYLWRARSGDMF